MSAVPHSAVVPALSPALRSFEAEWQRRRMGSADALTALRDSAMKRVLALGLPTTRDETWRYTSVRHLAAHPFQNAPEAAPSSMISAAVSRSLLHGVAGAMTIVMVNGNPILAGMTPNSSIEIKSLQDIARTDPGKIAAHLPPPSDADQARWGLLNTALFTDGLYLRISGELAAPLVILHLLHSEGANNIAHPRVIIDAAPHARATIVEHFVEQGVNPPLCNSATHVTAGRHSQLTHYRVFQTGTGAEHIDSLHVRQERDSRCEQFTLAVGGALVRASLEAQLEHAGASLASYSLLVGHESRHVDCVNVVTHGAPNTRSTQTARAIASGTSRVVFNTKVIVKPGAVHSESQQSCRGLLLSPTAEIDTRPQLEIHADEVKCAHGATTGRLDPEMLFYMLSRGLDRDTAQSLLVYAFLSDVLTHISLPAARSAIEDALIAQLPNPEYLKKFR